ncbi:putative glutathione S-transferase [Tieghemostelium lacteum]|uniref:Putative glutathione S-transferase n=1 Tax=Tieghemostelium lacteum TaxID=361077 RepID=A0A152A2T5_TIELA|nr:putative glutathione S-transferase [Tieghemostelium lacteum]|eukprot:KYR00519.1 putative glutathione S-transferase [Tieghemostelium lacteum]
MSQTNKVNNFFKDSIDVKGRFIRKDAAFRNQISETHEIYKPETGRYHLYVGLFCPWACRTLIVRALKGLEDVIDVSIVDYFLGPNGCQFSEREGSTVDRVNGFEYLRSVYFATSPGYTGRYTVPVLFDKKTNTIVNNESSEIIRMFNTVFNKWAKNPEGNFYPEELRTKIDAVNEWVYPMINNGVYRAGFSTTQEAYEEAYHDVFNGLDRVEDILSKQKYLVGDTFTEADIRLFTTLIRFDAVYFVHFKCNKKLLRDYPNVSKYTREIYHMPGVKDTVNFHHIKHHYFESHTQINPYGITPLGPNLDYLN